MKNSIFITIIILLWGVFPTCNNNNSGAKLNFNVPFSKALSDQARDGRVILLLSDQEPRFLLKDGPDTLA